MSFQFDNCRRILVVSPHLDDGVLSVGGIIERAVRNGAEVTVATPFTEDLADEWPWPISPFAQQIRDFWGLGPHPFERRRQEDIAAVSSLGAHVVHGDLFDAIYRTDVDGTPVYPTRQSIFEPPPDFERASTSDALYGLIEVWMDKLSPDLMLGPLSVGRHVDHLLTADVLTSMPLKRSVRLALYEDMPYAAGQFPVATPRALDEAVFRMFPRVSYAEIVPVDLPGKLAAIAHYASQIPDIFPNGQKFEDVMGAYMSGYIRGAYSERIWVRDW